MCRSRKVFGPIEFEPHVSADVADDAPAVSDAVDQTQAPPSGGVGLPHRDPDAGPAVDHLDANRVIGQVGAEADSLLRANLAADYVYGPPNIGHLSRPNAATVRFERFAWVEGVGAARQWSRASGSAFRSSVERARWPTCGFGLAALVEKFDSRHAR